VPLTRAIVAEALDAFDIDPEHGGTGSKRRDYRGTKFPRPPVWGFLLSQAKKPGNERLAKLTHLTLAKMLEGGIYDHLGGGFHRYSTERTWTVPHFEKMLYDNAQLVELYSEAYALDPRPEYKRVVAETLAFVRREMTAPEGGFYSALDADSNEKEGEFYVWTADELAKVLGNDADAALVKAVYGVSAPNFEEKFHILRLPKPLSRDREGAKALERTAGEARPAEEEAVRPPREAGAAVPGHEGDRRVERADDRRVREGRAGVRQQGVGGRGRDRRRLRTDAHALPCEKGRTSRRFPLEPPPV
jgi:uncharacterized protein YyaL (SSP411 family)